MTELIAAVVVTYNRLSLLKDCIHAIRQQTQPVDSIIVINNGSTDNTAEWLDQQNDLIVVHQNNVGGAGGFHRGIKEAFLRNFSWIWVMDDDGIPNDRCLLFLLEAAKKYQTWYASPNLVDFEGVSHFSHLFDNSPSDVIYTVGGPFNGILFKHELIREIGYPNSTFYIWGDEYEYTDRIIEKGLPVITVKNAIQTHKRTGFKTQKCPRPYYFVRNRFWRYRAVKGNFINRRLLKFQAVDIAVRLFIKGLLYLNLKQAKEVIRGIYDGMYKNFNEKYN